MTTLHVCLALHQNSSSPSCPCCTSQQKASLALFATRPCLEMKVSCSCKFDSLDNRCPSLTHCAWKHMVTAWHSMVQHSTAQHGTAQHSAATRRTDLHSRMRQYNCKPKFILPMYLACNVSKGQGLQCISFQGI